MLTKLRIINFKCLADTGELEIRPLTFLVGPNSSGKSSLLQALLALRQTVDSTDIENPLAANDGWVTLGGYSDFVYRHETNRRFEVFMSFCWRPTDEQRRFFPQGSRMTFDFKVVFYYNPQTTQVELELAESVFTVEGALHFWQQMSRKGFRHYQWQFRLHDSEPPKEWSFEIEQPLKFYGVTLQPGPPEDWQRALPGLLHSQVLSSILQNELQNIFYIGPLREYPKRVYVTSGQVPQDVGMKGERAVEVLWAAYRTERLGEMLEHLQRWMKEFGIASELKLDQLGETNHYRVLLVDPITNVEVSLSDVGFGASQLLPVIVECFYAPPDSLLLIEQPEIHLHPKAQAHLGDLFVEATKNRDRRMIIETHSEHILARVRRRIAEEKIAREDIAIYYFEPTSEGSRVREITLNEYGQFEDFPEGFLEEDVEEAFAHLQAMRDRIKKESS